MNIHLFTHEAMRIIARSPSSSSFSLNDPVRVVNIWPNMTRSWKLKVADLVIMAPMLMWFRKRAVRRVRIGP